MVERPDPLVRASAGWGVVAITHRESVATLLDMVVAENGVRPLPDSVRSLKSL